MKVADPAELFAYPPDAPETMRATAAEIGRWGEAMRDAASALTRGRSSLAAGWEGPAADRATTSLSETARWADDVASRADRSRAAIDRYAAGLDHARGEIDRLRQQFGQAQTRAAALDRAAAQGTVQPAQFLTQAATLMTAQATAHAQYRGVLVQVAAMVHTATAALPSAPTVLATSAAREDPNDRILNEYQVEADGPLVPLTLTGFNAWLAEHFAGNLSGTMVTPHELEMLRKLTPYQLYMFQRLRDQAFSEADRRYASPDQNDDHNDAFRHAYWNALLAQHFGPDWAAEYTTAHEAIAGNQGPREAMDLYNNEVGRSVASDPTNPYRTVNADLADQVAAAVEEGRLLVIGSQGELRWSDEVTPAQTATLDLVDNLPELAGQARDRISGVGDGQAARS